MFQKDSTIRGRGTSTGRESERIMEGAIRFGMMNEQRGAVVNYSDRMFQLKATSQGV